MITSLVLVLFFGVGFALKIDGIGPLGLFQHCAGFGIVGVSKLLHSINVRTRKDLNLLIDLLGHSRFPFDYVYEYGCGPFMNKRRIKELAKSANKFHLVETERNLLIPINCVKLKELNIELFKPGHYFAHFPADRTPLPSMKSKNFLFHLNEARKSTGLIQNCNWLFQIGVPKTLQLDPPRVSFGTRRAWQFIHHSCYLIDPTRLSSEMKYVRLMENLVREYPLQAINLNEDDISELSRWCLHLSLIMLNLGSQYDYLNRSGAVPVRDYLVSLERRISNHLEKVETNSLRIYHFGLVEKLLSTISEFYLNNRISEVFKDPQISGLRTTDFDVTLDMLRGGLDSEQEKTRWTLCLLELNHYLDQQFWKKEGTAIDLFETHFPKATQLEQYNWAKLYIKARGNEANTLDFATRPILLAVQASESITTRLLHELSLSNARQLGFLLYAIPYDRRLKEIRYRHLTDRLLQRQIGKMQASYTFMQRLPNISKTVAYQLIRFMEDGLLKHEISGKSKFRLNGDVSLAFVSWMLSLMTIYQFRWSLDLDKNQVALLLGRQSLNPMEVFRSINELRIGEGMKVHDRLEQAQAMAHRVLPRLLSFNEILPLLLPKQELLDHKN